MDAIAYIHSYAVGREWRERARQKKREGKTKSGEITERIGWESRETTTELCMSTSSLWPLYGSLFTIANFHSPFFLPSRPLCSLFPHRPPFFTFLLPFPHLFCTIHHLCSLPCILFYALTFSFSSVFYFFLDFALGKYCTSSGTKASGTWVEDDKRETQVKGDYEAQRGVGSSPFLLFLYCEDECCCCCWQQQQHSGLCLC